MKWIVHVLYVKSVFRRISIKGIEYLGSCIVQGGVIVEIRRLGGRKDSVVNIKEKNNNSNNNNNNNNNNLINSSRSC